MRPTLLLIILFSILITNCSSTEYSVKFEEETDMVTTDDLKSYLDKTENPSIVLRVPRSGQDLTQENSANSYNSAYNTIEKELLRAGFDVRDRGLFQQILDNTGEEIKYSELQSQTDTDLILELVEIDPKVEFTTNTYYSETEDLDTFSNGHSLSAYGAKVEFKVVLIKNNQYAGSYVFYYEPCSDSCPIKFSGGNSFGPSSGLGKPYFVEKEPEEMDEEDPYQYVSKSVFENFVQDVTQKLVDEMRKGR